MRNFVQPETRIAPNATVETWGEHTGKTTIRHHGGIIPVDVISITLE